MFIHVTNTPLGYWKFTSCPCVICPFASDPRHMRRTWITHRAGSLMQQSFIISWSSKTSSWILMCAWMTMSWVMQMEHMLLLFSSRTLVTQDSAFMKVSRPQLYSMGTQTMGSCLTSSVSQRTDKLSNPFDIGYAYQERNWLAFISIVNERHFLLFCFDNGSFRYGFMGVCFISFCCFLSFCGGSIVFDSGSFCYSFVEAHVKMNHYRTTIEPPWNETKRTPMKP